MPDSNATRSQRRSKYGDAYYVARDPRQPPMLRQFAWAYLGMMQRTGSRDYQVRGRDLASYWRGDDGFWRCMTYMAMDLGERPGGSEWSIDRIDNDCGYEAGNIRWATREVQGRNKSASSWIRAVNDGKASTAPDKLLVAAWEAASIAKCSEKTLENWRAAGKGPPFIRFSGERRGVRYKLDELKKWIDEQT